jgi:signal transduction histidine kinase/response regulator RpfG family c-di-GMP phosphodiesterase
MVVLSYFFTSTIVHKYLRQNTDNIFTSVQARIMADLEYPQVTLEGFTRTVRNMVMRGDDSGKLQEYFNDISEYLSFGKRDNISFNGFIGYFETLPDGPALIESFFLDEPDGDVPTERQWYLDAVFAEGETARTIIYNDSAMNGDSVLIISICIFDDEGRRLGVVGVRVQIKFIGEYIINTTADQGGYGVLLDENLFILAHPNIDYVGRRTSDPAVRFSVFYDELLEGKEINEYPLITFRDEPAVASFKKLSNGWYLGTVMLEDLYYRDVTNMATVLVILGITLASLMVFFLIRIDIARNKSDMENRNKSSFLANVSHEIRTPMNAIMGMSDILLYEPLSKRQVSYVNDIKTAAHSLLSIINDILDMSKIESGRMQLNPVNFDFYIFLDNIFSMFSYVIKKKGLEFYNEVEGDIPDYLYGDDIRLKQVLTNICGNAVKYTEKGYVKLKVAAGDGSLTFEIEDTGMGIRKENLAKLFNTFQRIETEKNRNVVGTGLGLSISKNFVEMMGGKILVESEYERGSVFRVIIPIVLGDKAGIKSKKISSKGHILHAPGAKILVVDDNEFNIKVAVGLFGLFKIKVQTACSGKEAIDLVQKDEFDIVFMDHMMPEMDGVEATAEIRKLGGKYKYLPIIALTANAVHGIREMFLSNGFFGFISKPIDMQEMFGILKEWLPPEKISEEIIDEKMEGIDEKPSSEFLNALNNIGEINTEIGLDRVSGIENMYRETVELFTKRIIPECDAMSAAMQGGDINKFAVLIHAMKSALSTIGAMSLSEAALRLETASKNNDIEFCMERFPVLREKMLNLHEELSAVFPGEGAAAKKKAGDKAYFQEQLMKALVAAADFDEETGLKAINGLLVYDFGERNNAVLEDAAAAFKDFNFEAVKELLSKPFE